MKGTEQRLGWRVSAKSLGKEAEGSDWLALRAMLHRARGGRGGQDLILRGPDCPAEEPARSLWQGHVCPQKISTVQMGRHRLGTVRRLLPTRADASRPQGLAQEPRWLEQAGSPLWGGTGSKKGQGRHPKEGECSLDPEAEGDPGGSTAGTKVRRQEDT